MTMEYKEPPKPRIEKISPDSNFADDEGEWLVICAANHLGAANVRYALIHLDDGVLWGRVEGDKLILPRPGDWTPKLRSVTVQQCRLFGDKGELFIWRESEGRWRGRVVIEEGENYDPIIEPQVLNGNRVYRNETEQARRVWATVPNGFTPIIELETGMHQIVPIEISERDFEANKRAFLTVYHYLSPDDDGQAKFFCSRLKSIEIRRPDRDGK
jgi:CRISPR-associated protein (TIGR03984 family)